MLLVNTFESWIIFNQNGSFHTRNGDFRLLTRRSCATTAPTSGTRFLPKDAIFIPSGAWGCPRETKSHMVLLPLLRVAATRGDCEAKWVEEPERQPPPEMGLPFSWIRSSSCRDNVNPGLINHRLINWRGIILMGTQSFWGIPPY